MKQSPVTRSRAPVSDLVAISFGGLLLSMVSLSVNFPLEAHAVVGMKAPDVTSPAWINAEPQSLGALRGRVVLVEFWTFGCYNCRNVEPYVKQWHERYADRGLVVIGIHSPEFAYEKSVEAVTRYVQEHNIRYAVAVDNEFVNWHRFGNRYWPAMYLIDKSGVIRYVRIGEGGYGETERVIQMLLAEAP